MRHVLEGELLVLEDHFPDVGGELCLVDLGVPHPVEQHVGHRLLVPARQAPQHVDDLAAALLSSRPAIPKSIMAMRLSGR